MKKHLPVCGFFALALLSSTALPGMARAAVQPDAGQTLQNLKQQEPVAAPETSAPPSIPVPKESVTAPGGPKVLVEDVRIEGNTVFTATELTAQLGDFRGKHYDLAGLKALAERITRFYQSSDYPFARAIVPEQSTAGNLLHLVVVEGRYGTAAIVPENDQLNERHVKQAQKFLSAIPEGGVIRGSELERLSLTLDDQPGYSFAAAIRPGEQPGTGNVLFPMKEDEQRYHAQLGIDNYGNRYTGRLRAVADVSADSLLMFGDQASISTLYSEEDMWFGNAGYSAPLGISGLRGQLGYAHTYYELGGEFKNLDAHGVADVLSAGLRYPLLRSREESLFLSATYQRKWLTDEQGSSGSDDTKSSNLLPVALDFNTRDAWLGGGITYGTLRYTHGILSLDGGLRATDNTTAKTDGHFDKLNLDIVRLQSTALPALTVFGRFSGQAALDNLDSSEDFGLGGPGGVRAYPTGEAFGDEGVLVQAELRYTIDVVTPYLFYDYGHSRTNHSPWTTGDNGRSLGGGGIGARAHYEAWTASTSAAWRQVGGEPKSDSRDYLPMLWFSLGRSF